MLIAYTIEHVTLPSRGVGDKINLEVDQMGKYVETVVRGMLESSCATEDAQENGQVNEGNVPKSVIRRLIENVVAEKVNSMLKEKNL